MKNNKIPKEQFQYCDQPYIYCKNCPKVKKCESPVNGIIKE